MRRPLAITGLVLLLTASGAAAPTTTPTTAPGAPSIARWFDQLADPDPAVRDAANDQLMGLPADALPTLLDVVRAAGPLRPAQGAVLREIVGHVFLTAEPYLVAEGTDPFDPTVGQRYILGQDWPRGMQNDDRQLGVPVVNRWPGFPARRCLRDGDLILGLYDDPKAPADRPPDSLTPATGDLVQAMRDCPTRPLLTMSVLRDGRVIRVSATMVAEPARTVHRRPGVVAGFLADRAHAFDAYWDARFAPLVRLAEAVDGDGPPDSTDGHAR